MLEDLQISSRCLGQGGERGDGYLLITYPQKTMVIIFLLCSLYIFSKGIPTTSRTLINRSWARTVYFAIPLCFEDPLRNYLATYILVQHEAIPNYDTHSRKRKIKSARMYSRYVHAGKTCFSPRSPKLWLTISLSFSFSIDDCCLFLIICILSPVQHHNSISLIDIFRFLFPK